ncbi:Uncharacterised protein [Mycobacteroides abscessus]|uniref:Uncharacterized protein n=3 Tax=Mycobacteroides abscessus TaxID=36809 RepID=A0A829HUB4_9MYCO|nr:hypothetical protein MYCMA_07685 [Mycobacteroides abscessus subsp. massiliense str. GO 06]AMU26747.1 hypothetical protein A3N96_16305 [Mycobacteroides abscessus]EHC00824.1 hypothetical protein MAB47J26_04895 [Mycobacteroides abscessus 47J26]EIU67208.1 hypothetical protein MM1S1520914_3063 [Mycobacteroides abscessus subsp. bolletii 1S-152-0914]EIU83551.1 hypothetical protein MM2B0626_2780 [Mycobacteroides abscessus subsp. bolletii 2B-0626]EIV11979.1 hypothetical protein MM2B0912R_3180 [Mycob
MRHTDEMFAQLWNRVSALFRRGGAHVVASPPAAVLYLQGRHWQHKYLDVLADLRVLEEVYSLPVGEEFTRARAHELSRAAEGFFKTCRELADWIKEETGCEAIEHVHATQGRTFPSPLQLCDAVAQTAKHHTRSITKQKPDPISATAGMVYRGENGLQADIAWHTKQSGISTVDALALAKECITEWQSYLQDNGLGTTPPADDLSQLFKGSPWQFYPVPDS